MNIDFLCKTFNLFAVVLNNCVYLHTLRANYTFIAALPKYVESTHDHFRVHEKIEVIE